MSAWRALITNRFFLRHDQSAAVWMWMTSGLLSELLIKADNPLYRFSISHPFCQYRTCIVARQ